MQQLEYSVYIDRPVLELKLPADSAATTFTGCVRVLDHAECTPDKLGRKVNRGAVEKWERNGVDEKRAGCDCWVDEVAARRESAQRTRRKQGRRWKDE